MSHDRDFLDRVVTWIILPEGDGRFIEYAGGYADMLAQRGATWSATAVERRGGRAQRVSRRRLAFRPGQSGGSISTIKHALETLHEDHRQELAAGGNTARAATPVSTIRKPFQSRIPPEVRCVYASDRARAGNRGGRRRRLQEFAVKDRAGVRTFPASLRGAKRRSNPALVNQK